MEQQPRQRKTQSSSSLDYLVRPTLSTSNKQTKAPPNSIYAQQEQNLNRMIGKASNSSSSSKPNASHRQLNASSSTSAANNRQFTHEPRPNSPKKSSRVNNLHQGYAAQTPSSSGINKPRSTSASSSSSPLENRRRSPSRGSSSRDDHPVYIKQEPREHTVHEIDNSSSEGDPIEIIAHTYRKKLDHKDQANSEAKARIEQLEETVRNLLAKVRELEQDEKVNAQVVEQTMERYFNEEKR